jgi:hypothetical protein
MILNDQATLSIRTFINACDHISIRLIAIARAIARGTLDDGKKRTLPPDTASTVLKAPNQPSVWQRIAGLPFALLDII